MKAKAANENEEDLYLSSGFSNDEESDEDDNVEKKDALDTEFGASSLLAFKNSNVNGE